jgi:hypothetical protein
MEQEMLSQIYSGGFNQSQDTQQFVLGQDSYPLFTQTQSQSQNSQQLNFMNQKKDNLPIIEEENNPFSQINLSDKQQLISQQIEQLYSESQKCDSEKIESNQFEMQQVQFTGNNYSEKTSFNPSPYIPNQGKSLPKNGSTKKLATHLEGVPNSGILTDFKSRMSEFRNNLCNLVSEAKQKFFELADKNLSKLLENVGHIENILISETETTLQEEMRNKVIDQKVEVLFKEIFSLLNDLGAKQSSFN